MYYTFYGRNIIYYVITISNLSFHDFLPTFYCTQLKMLMVGKKSAYFQILSYYFINLQISRERIFDEVLS